MVGKSQPKLFKMVCKQAELMRAPFHGSLWPNKISQINKKKSVVVNKTEEKNRSNVAKLNVKKKHNEHICPSTHKQ
jgi:hypothetical protein